MNALRRMLLAGAVAATMLCLTGTASAHERYGGGWNQPHSYYHHRRYYWQAPVQRYYYQYQQPAYYYSYPSYQTYPYPAWGGYRYYGGYYQPQTHGYYYYYRSW